MARVSSKQVADYAGVSIATVSHVINGTRFVSAETQQKVLDAISALHYRPNAVARGLATNSTREIGLVVSDNLMMLFGYWELTSITSFLLIGFDQGRERARRAAFQALLVTVAVSLTTSLAVGAVVIDRVRITDLVKGGLS